MPKDTLIKETSKIIESSIEVGRCKKCKHLFECKNNVEGYVYYPINNNGIIEFCYIPRKYKKEMDKKTSYLNNIYSYSLPNDIKMASMKDINLDDKNRFEVITWIKKYIDDYLNGIKRKGLYLTGNFGSGKTYLLSAMLNELAKNGHKVAIVYYPEFLRSLKESMYDSEDFNMKFNRVKNSELLLIDDIGAEALTPWARDEVLGTILDDTISNALFVSNRKDTDNNIQLLVPEIKKAVKSIYIQRGSEGSKSLSELGTSNTFENPLEEMEKSIVKNGKRKIY